MHDVTEHRDEIAADYQRMVGEVRAFALKHGLPMPTIVVEPKWRDAIARGTHHALFTDRMQYMGVSFRFGRFRQGEIFQ